MSALYPEAFSLSAPRPRAVLVDAGFTLTFFDGARIAAHAAQAGVTASPTAIQRAEALLRAEVKELEGTPLRTHDDGGDSYLRRVFRRLLELAETPGTTADLERAAVEIGRQHLLSNVWRRVGPGVPAALARLRAAGLRLAVVSNSEGTIDAMLTEVGLRSYFETVVDSAVVGSVKPDAPIFHIALSRLGLAPADAIMVGDSPTADIHGAQAIPLRAALLDPHDLYPWIKAPRFPDLPAFTNALLATR